MYVLISYFDPFNNAEFNFSQLVAYQLQKNIKGLKVELVGLPTVFEQAAITLKKTFDELIIKYKKSPLFVLSIGEGREDLRFELEFHNKDHNPNVADNLGTHKIESPINLQGPSILYDQLQLKKIFESLTPSYELLKPRLSTSAGSFVCNNTAYLFSSFDLGVPYGFIHVPSHKSLTPELEEQTFECMAEVINKLIQRFRIA